jgi:flagellar biosynthesis activator protein FlaF
MYKNAAQAYGKAERPTLTGRPLEGRAFARAAQMLNDARDAVDDRRQAVKALRYNHQLWTIMQASLQDANNELPSDTTANIMSLSLFVDKRTSEALANPDVSLLDALIDINRNMSQGQLFSN